MGDVTVGEIIIEKKKNLYNYLQEIIKDEKIQISNEQKLSFNKYTSKILTSTVEEFIFYISTELFQYKGQEKLYIKKIFDVSGVTDIEIIDIHIDKLTRYIKLFIELIESSL